VAKLSPISATAEHLFTVSPSRDKNRNFDKFDILGQGQIWRARADPRYTLTGKFRLDRFILSPSGGQKKQNFAVFGLRHFLVSPVGGNLRKWHMTRVHNYKPSPIQRH